MEKENRERVRGEGCGEVVWHSMARMNTMVTKTTRLLLSAWLAFISGSDGMGKRVWDVF